MASKSSLVDQYLTNLTGNTNTNNNNNKKNSGEENTFNYSSFTPFFPATNNNNKEAALTQEELHEQLQMYLFQARQTIKQLQAINEFPNINQYFTREAAMNLLAKYLFPTESEEEEEREANQQRMMMWDHNNHQKNVHQNPNNNMMNKGNDFGVSSGAEASFPNEGNEIWGLPSAVDEGNPNSNSNHNNNNNNNKFNHNNNNKESGSTNNNKSRGGREDKDDANNNNTMDVMRQNKLESAKVLDEGLMLAFVEFKRSRIRKYISHNKDIYPGMYVLVDGDRGSDCGLLVQTIVKDPNGGSNGSLEDAPVSVTCMEGCDVRDEKIKLENGKVIRVASDQDIDKLHNVISRAEAVALKTCKQRCAELGIDIHMLDVEYQFDMKKISFFFDADHSIDFRELVRELYRTFGARIWMENVNPNVKNAMPGEEGYQGGGGGGGNHNNNNDNNNNNNNNRQHGGGRRGGGGRYNNNNNKRRDY